MRTTVADAAAAVLLAAALPEADPGVSAAARELQHLVADDILMLEIAGWVGAGGPDGEQLYCLADLLRGRLDGDGALAAEAGHLVGHDGAAVAALETLARLNAAAGRTGAAAWCRTAGADVRSAGRPAVSLRPGPSRR